MIGLYDRFCFIFKVFDGVSVVSDLFEIKTFRIQSFKTRKIL